MTKNNKKMTQNNSRQPKETKKSKVLRTDGPTNRRTDRPTDQPTDGAGCRVACTRLKSNISCIISYIGDRKIIGTQDSLGHRFWLAAPKIWAQIRPCPQLKRKYQDGKWSWNFSLSFVCPFLFRQEWHLTIFMKTNGFENKWQERNE